MTGIAHVYLHKNVPDDEIAFTCTVFSFLSTLPIERVRNNQPELAYAGNHILTSTKYTVTIHKLLYMC
jgi:hypothetical protein